MSDLVVWSGVGSVGGLVAFTRGFGKLRALRRIENTPTSTVRSMPMGLVELHGIAVTEESLTGPFSAKPVAFYRIRVEEYRRSGRHSRWVTLHEETSFDPFWLEDPTGRVLILPDGADLHLPADFTETFNGNHLPAGLEGQLDERGVKRSFLGLGKRLRLTEWHIGVGQSCYVHGLAQERPGLRELQRDRVRELLREVKGDPDAMRALDTDGDGRVDAQEWDRAREAVTDRVGAEGLGDRVAVARGSSRDLFLISNRSEKDLVRALRWETALYVFGGGAVFVAGTSYLVHWLGWIG